MIPEPPGGPCDPVGPVGPISPTRFIIKITLSLLRKLYVLFINEILNS
jgi:hypothetical protein